MEMSSSLSSSTPSAAGGCSSVPSTESVSVSQRRRRKRKATNQLLRWLKEEKEEEMFLWLRHIFIPDSPPGSFGASPVQVLGIWSLHLRCTLKRQSRHCRPCLKSPLSSFLQWWQTVGFVYEWTTNVCGILIRPAISFSIQNGRPALIDGRPCFWILGLVLPLDGLFETLYEIKSAELHNLEKKGGSKKERKRDLPVWRWWLWIHRCTRWNRRSCAAKLTMAAAGVRASAKKTSDGYAYKSNYWESCRRSAYGSWDRRLQRNSWNSL